MRDDLEGRIAMQVNSLAGEACRQAFRSQMHEDARREDCFAPPMFRMPGVELPIVPRVGGLPRIEGAGRKDARR